MKVIIKTRRGKAIKTYAIAPNTNIFDLDKRLHELFPQCRIAYLMEG